MERIRLTRHLTLVLLIKAVALYGLWSAFFSSPPPVGTEAVGEALIGPDNQRTDR